MTHTFCSVPKIPFFVSVGFSCFHWLLHCSSNGIFTVLFNKFPSIRRCNLCEDVPVSSCYVHCRNLGSKPSSGISILFSGIKNRIQGLSDKRYVREASLFLLRKKHWISPDHISFDPTSNNPRFCTSKWSFGFWELFLSSLVFTQCCPVSGFSYFCFQGSWYAPSFFRMQESNERNRMRPFSCIGEPEIQIFQCLDMCANALYRHSVSGSAGTWMN